LEIHQRAFVYAVKMASTVHKYDDDRRALIGECYDFWDANCLYLTNKARWGFRQAVNEYSMYKVYWESWRMHHSNSSDKQLERAFADIQALPDIIANGVDLEAMGSRNLPEDGKKFTPYGPDDETPEEKA